MDPIAQQAANALDYAVADLRDYMARASRLRLQFEHAKNEEINAYRKVQGCQESLVHCYANNPFGGMNDIIERRKQQLADAERAWQESTLYVAQLRSEVAEISELEIEHFSTPVAERMREQDGQELACANEMIVDRTTKETAPASLQSIKIVAKEPHIRTAMVYGSPEGRPVTAPERSLAIRSSSPSHGHSPMIADRLDPLPSLPPIGSTSTQPTSLANASGYATRYSPLRTPQGTRIGSAIATTAYGDSVHANGIAIKGEATSSGLRAASAMVESSQGDRAHRVIRGTSQAPVTLASINFREADSPVVVAKPGHFGDQSAILAVHDESDGKYALNHVTALEGQPHGYKASINGQLQPIPLSPPQMRALEHSPFFRPGSALVYTNADASAIAAQYQPNLDNSKCVAISPLHVSRERRPLSRPAYYSSPTAEKVKHSVTMPNAPLTEKELVHLFARLDMDGDDLLTMYEVSNHFDSIGTFGIPNHSAKFITASLKRPFVSHDKITFDEFAYLVAKWATL